MTPKERTHYAALRLDLQLAMRMGADKPLIGAAVDAIEKLELLVLQRDVDIETLRANVRALTQRAT